MQLTHYNSSFTQRSFPVTLITDNVSNALNIGSLFRVADAFGVQQLILCGSHVSMGRKMTKTSRATEKSVSYEIKEDVIEVIRDLKDKNYQIIVLEITSKSKPLHQLTFETDAPLALVVGDENFGITNDILNTADEVIHIEMFGQNSSMNVVQATNIALYEITRQFL
ncbi:MAG: TrmH family RNA methyltransferase [Bacteroidia bacterium]|nr:TrmH family RNA methyltransferase [Bacteroidia bacterium]NND51805.1 TrmH family RNA methyltransferase [Flavobacteriaceae bacterium]